LIWRLSQHEDKRVVKGKLGLKRLEIGFEVEEGKNGELFLKLLLRV
jgi:hypothetical protein